RTRGLEDADAAAHIVACSRSPGIAVTADYHPLIRPTCAPDDANGVPDLVKRARAPLGLDAHPCALRSRTDVITERQRALPALRHRGPGHRLQETSRIPVAHRDDGDLRNVDGILRDAPRAF